MEKYLVKVEPGANNNKYYKMVVNGSTLNVEYGRVGASPQHRSYPAYQFDSKYDEKIRKGYKDMTDLMAKKSKESIECSADDLYVLLATASKQFIDATYISSNATPQMIEEGERLIRYLLRARETKNEEEFNKKLIELFALIPRRMKHVKDFLYQGDFNSIITREVDALDVLKGQLTTEVDTTESSKMIDLFNMDFFNIEVDVEKKIKRMLGENEKHFNKAWEVKNFNTTTSFEEFVPEKKKVELLWHGSRTENWWSIAKSGLLIRPSNAVYTGSMFGDGIYFANKAQKSIGYTSFEGSYWARGNGFGLLALYDVHYGNPYKVNEHTSEMSRMNHESLKRKGNYDCLHAQAGKSLRNDEIIVYRPEQCNIRYLVKIQK